MSQFRVCNLRTTRPLNPSETLLTSSVVVKCDGRAFGAFPGCVTTCFTLTSRFLPPRPAKVTIYTTRCRRFLSCCVSIQGLHPSEEHLKANYVTTPQEGSFFSLFLEDAWLLSFVASHISRFFARPKKEEREKMAPSHGIDRDVRVKHLVMQPGNAPKARPSHLTTADVVNKVSEGLAFKDCKGRVLQRTQTLN